MATTAFSSLAGRLWLGRRFTLWWSLLVVSAAVSPAPVRAQVIDSACQAFTASTAGLSSETSADPIARRSGVERVAVEEPAAPTVVAPDPEQLPVLALPRGWRLNQALSMPYWLTVSVSALSQNNGTLSGLESHQFTSSNLFNLGFRLVPLAAFKGGSAMGTTAPRQGADVGEYPYYNIAINGLLTQRAGQILSSLIPNELNTQWNFGNGSVGRLGFLNLEYKSDGDFVSMLKLGKLMQAEDFTMNPIQCYFANFGFCGWAQGVPAMIEIPGNPFNSYGAVVAFGDSQSVNFRYGIYQIAPATFAPDLHGFDFRFNKGIGVAQFAELRLPISIQTRVPVRYDKVSGKVAPSTWQQADAVYQSLLPPGTFTLGGWLGSGSFPTIVDPESSGSQNNGAYGILSFRIPGWSLGLDHRAFISGGMGFSPNVQQFRSGGNAGLVVEGLLPKRPFDTFSIGTSYASYQSDYYLTGAAASSFTPGTEWAAELNYSININQSTRIMPNLQIIFNPSGDSNRSPVVVAGLQAWYFF